MGAPSREAIRAFYDRLGAGLDSQAFYEDPALDALIAEGCFEAAHAVFEFGCGTGRLAAHLLRDFLPPDCRYEAVDLSPKMVALARKRLAPWEARVRVEVTAGEACLPCPAAGCDRFITTFVLDLLDEREANQLVAEAHRVLIPDGLLCLASLTDGAKGWQRLVSRLWRAVYALASRLLGGCRPIDLAALLPATEWETRAFRLVTAYGLSLAVAVAAPRR